MTDLDLKIANEILKTLSTKDFCKKINFYNNSYYYAYNDYFNDLLAEFYPRSKRLVIFERYLFEIVKRRYATSDIFAIDRFLQEFSELISVVYFVDIKVVLG